MDYIGHMFLKINLFPVMHHYKNCLINQTLAQISYDKKNITDNEDKEKPKNKNLRLIRHKLF